jgi:hypothetical protein
VNQILQFVYISRAWLLHYETLFLNSDYDICDEFVGAQIYCRSVFLTILLLTNEVAVAQSFVLRALVVLIMIRYDF